MSELQLYSFNLLVVDDLVIPLFNVICISARIAIRSLTILYISIRRFSRLRSCQWFPVLTFSSFPLHMLFFRSRCKRNGLLDVGLIRDGQCPFASKDPTLWNCSLEQIWQVMCKVEVARFVILLICDDYFKLSLISSPRYGFSFTCSSRWLSSE